MKEQFALKDVLERDNLQYIDTDNTGKVEVMDLESNEMFKIPDIQKYAIDYLEENDPDKLMEYRKGNVEIAINSTEDPVQKSPVSIKDRMALSFGNIEGNKKFLKNKYFEEVKLNLNKELVGKKGNTWYSIDPKMLGDGDAWDLAKEFGADFADLVGAAIPFGGNIAGEVAGGAVGGVPGFMAGGLAGAAIGETIRTSFGRLSGTYDASVEEQLMDSGLEALLSLGGYGAAKGVTVAAKFAKPLLNPVINTLKNFKNIPRESKELLSSFLSTTTGVARSLSDRVVHDPDNVGKFISQYSSNPASYDALANRVVNENAENLGTTLKGYMNGVFNKFKEMEGKFLNSKGVEGFTLDASNIKKAIFEGGELGDGYLLNGLTKDPVISKMFKESKPGVYEVISNAELNKMLDLTTSPDTAFNLAKTRSGLDSLVKGLNKLDFGILKGRAGAAKALEIKRSVDDFFFNVVKNSDEKAVIAPYTNGIREIMAKSLKKTDAGELYNSMNAFMKTNEPFILKTKSILNAKIPKEKLITMANNISNASSGDDVFTKQLLDAAASVTKQPNMSNEILNKSAALEFTKMFPFTKAGKIAGASLIIGSQLLPDSNGLGSIPLLAGTALVSPRLAAKGARTLVKSGAKVIRSSQNIAKYAGKIADSAGSVNEFIKGLSRNQTKQILENPGLLEATLAPVFTTLSNDQQR